jgi:hypothetical protein
VTGLYKGEYRFTGILVSGDGYGYSINLTEPAKILSRVETQGVWVSASELARTNLQLVEAGPELREEQVGYALGRTFLRGA